MKQFIFILAIFLHNVLFQYTEANYCEIVLFPLAAFETPFKTPIPFHFILQGQM